MTGAVFVATIGNQDLTYRQSAIFPSRTKGQELLESAKSEPEQFDMPILLPALKSVMSKVEIVKVLLIVTDQPETVAEHERQKDTLFIGRIIRELLSQHFKKFGLPKCPGAKAPEIFSVRENPVFVSNLLKSLKKTYFDKIMQFKNQNIESLFLLATGGVPSLNTAVTLLSNMAFRLNFHLLRVTKDGIAFPDRVSEDLGKFDLENRLKSYFHNYDFTSVAREIEQEKVSDYPYRQLACIARCYHQRLLFNFEGAISKLVDSWSDAGALEHLYGSLIDELKPATTSFSGSEIEKMSFRVSELIQNIYIKFFQQDYVDAAGRMFRMIEELALILTSRAFDKELVFDGRGYPGFAEIIRENPVFAEVARKKFHDSFSPEKFSIDFALLVFDKIVQDKMDVSNFEEINTFSSIYKDYKLGQLKQKRNKSILGHDFKSVTKADFPDDFYALLNELASLAKITPPEQKLKENIQQMLNVIG